MIQLIIQDVDVDSDSEEECSDESEDEDKAFDIHRQEAKRTEGETVTAWVNGEARE